MFDDEPEDYESSALGPIHPDDRLWRHPSEVSSAPMTPATRRSIGSGRTWAVAVVAGLTGAAVALTTMAVTGVFSTRVVDREQAITPVSVNVASVSTLSGRPRSVTGIIRDTGSVMAAITVSVDGKLRHGSGVIVRSDGVVLTTASLVDKADRITVTLGDGRIARGEVVGRDPSTGLALVKVPIGGLAVMVPNIRTPDAGDAAMMVAGATSPNEAAWISSATVRSVDGQTTSGGHNLVGLIVTDRSVPGLGDGSALVADDGTVSGVCLGTNSLAPDSETADDGPGYAVPIDVADAVADDLLTYGKARRAWLGVEGDDLTADAARTLGVPGGAVLSSVVSGSPAANAGLVASDVVVAVATRTVRSMSDLIALLPLHRPDDEVTVTFYRNDVRRTLLVKLGQRS